MIHKSNLAFLTFMTFFRNVQPSDSSGIVMMILIFTPSLLEDLPATSMGAASSDKSAAADIIALVPGLNEMLMVQSSG